MKRTVHTLLLVFFCCFTAIGQHTSHCRPCNAIRKALAPKNNTLRTTVEWLPFSTAGHHNHYWRQAAYSTSPIFKNNQVFNRQFALRVQRKLFTDLRWSSGRRSRIYATLHGGHAAWELNDDYDYYLGGPSLSYNGNTSGELLLLQTHEGISLEQTTLALGGECYTWKNPLFRWSFGAGVALHHFNLKANKHIAYTPWALDLEFTEPFEKPTSVRPYAELACTFGKRIYLSTRLRLDAPEIRANTNYSLYYEAADAPLRPVRVEGAAVQAQLLVGVGVQF